MQHAIVDDTVPLKTLAYSSVLLFSILTVVLGIYSSAAYNESVHSVGYDYEAPTFIFLTLTVFDIIKFVFPPAGRGPRDPTLAAFVLHSIPFISYLLRLLHVAPILKVVVRGQTQLIVPIRYIEWLCTTPFIQILLGTLGGAPTQTIQRVAAFNFLMILFGGVARLLTTAAVSYTLAAISCIFGALTMWGMSLLVDMIRSKSAADENTSGRVRLVGVLLLALYATYPVIFFLQFAGALPTVLREQIYAGLDVAAKCAATSVLLDGFFTLHVLELKSTKAALESSNNAKAAFSAFILQQTRVPVQALQATITEASKLCSNGSQSPLSAELEAVLAAAANKSNLLIQSLDDILVYRSLVMGAVSSHPRNCNLAELAKRVLRSAEGVCQTHGIRLNILLQQKLPQTGVFNDDRWLQAVDALLRRCCTSSKPGSTISILVFIRLQRPPMGTLQVCILDSSHVGDEKLLSWSDASNFFETFLIRDSKLSNLVAPGRIEKALTSGSNSDVDLHESRGENLAREASEALCMALVDRLATLIDGTIEVEQLPPRKNSRAKRVLSELESLGTILPGAIIEHFTTSQPGLFSHLQVPIALPSEPDVTIAVPNHSSKQRRSCSKQVNAEPAVRKQ